MAEDSNNGIMRKLENEACMHIRVFLAADQIHLHVSVLTNPEFATDSISAAIKIDEVLTQQDRQTRISFSLADSE